YRRTSVSRRARAATRGCAASSASRESARAPAGKRTIQVPSAGGRFLHGGPSTMMLGAIEQALKGITGSFDRLDKAAAKIARDGAGGDLAADMIDLKRAGHEARANVAAARTADEMIGTILDVLA